MSSSLFFFNDTATTEIYTLSLHDALPISERERAWQRYRDIERFVGSGECRQRQVCRHFGEQAKWESCGGRSEEHTSELQSPCNLVCRLLLEKKKKNNRDRNWCTEKRHTAP